MVLSTAMLGPACSRRAEALAVDLRSVPNALRPTLRSSAKHRSLSERKPKIFARVELLPLPRPDWAGPGETMSRWEQALEWQQGVMDPVERALR